MVSHIGAADYVVVGIMLIISLLIGVYYRLTGGKQKTNEEYLMANKNMSIFPVAFSLMASSVSAIAMLGVPNEIYVNGIQYVMLYTSYFFVPIIVSFTFLPVFFQLQKISVFEYLEMRFGRISRLVLSGSFILQRLLIMCIAIYAPSIALSATTGYSLTASMLCVGLVCTFYSTLGGMKAVLWTDVFQALLMLTTILAVLIKGSADNGGWSEIWNIALAGKRMKFFDFSPDPTLRFSFWSLLIGGTIQHINLYGTNQIQVQRLLTINSLRKSQLALLLSCPITVVTMVGFSFMGLVLYSKYHDCDPLLTKRIEKSDQLLLIFVMDYFAHIPGLAGLLVSGVLSASLSTVSSTINSLTAVTIEDFVKPVLKKSWKSEKLLNYYAKVVACAFGIFSTAIAFGIGELAGLVQMSLAFIGMFGGPTLGIFTLGIFWPRSTQRGVLFSFLTGLAVVLWIGLGAHIQKSYNPTLPRSVDGCSVMTNVSSFTNVTLPLPIQNSYPDALSNTTPHANSVVLSDPSQRNNNVMYLYRISFMWYGTIGFLIVMAGGMLTSLCEEKQHVSPNLFSPVCKYWYSNINHFQAEVACPVSCNTLTEGKDMLYTSVPFSAPLLVREPIKDTRL